MGENRRISPALFFPAVDRIVDFLRKKVLNVADNTPMIQELIQEIEDFYAKNPATLYDEYPLEARSGTCHVHAYFFSHPYRGGSDTHRPAGNGFWKLISDDKIVDIPHLEPPGWMEKKMVFYECDHFGRNVKTTWGVREFRAVAENGDMMGDWVLCKLCRMDRETYMVSMLPPNTIINVNPLNL